VSVLIENVWFQQILQAYLKTTGMCVEAGLELNSVELWPSRNWVSGNLYTSGLIGVGDPWHTFTGCARCENLVQSQI